MLPLRVDGGEVVRVGPRVHVVADAEGQVDRVDDPAERREAAGDLDG